MTSQAKPRVILIDPSPATRESLEERLRAADYEVESTDDSAYGANRALLGPPAALIADLWMPGLSGVQVCRLLHTEPATTDVPVLLRGDPLDPKSRFWAGRAGAAAYVEKDEVDQLMEALARCIAAAPAPDGFFMQLSGGSLDIQSRIAQHLDAALFESVIAAEVRTLGGAGSFSRLFELLSRLMSEVTTYRWLALSSTTPEHFAVHHQLGEAAAISDARRALNVSEAVEALAVEGQESVPDDEASVPIVQPLLAGGVRIGSIGFAVPLEMHPEAVLLLSFVARELGAPLGMVAANEKLQGAADFMREIYRAMPNALFVFDSAGLVRAVNDAALALLGYAEDELVGRPATLVFDASDLPNLETVEAQSRDANVLRSERSCMPKAGTRIPVLLSFTALAGKTAGAGATGIVCVAVDIRERKKLELDLYQAQKLEAVGRLAAGVAHEINTPIQFVNDSIHFVRDATKDLTSLIERYRALTASVAAGESSAEQAAEVGEAEENADLGYLLENLPRALDRSLEGLDRVAVIVRSMKEFAHPDRRDMIATDLNQAIRSTLTIARSEYRSVADVETDFGDIPLVTCHPGDVNQAVLNIVVNAAHAIGDIVHGTEQRGVIHVGTRIEDQMVVISIRDTGGGIPDSIATQVFDPFFTTKEVGKGTGQGLAIARSVVNEKHGGELSFSTEPGKGTTFFLRLPVHGKDAITLAAS